MKNTQPKGVCCFCGGNKILTFEHIPPKQAGNSKIKLIQGGEELFDTTSYKYQKKRTFPRGFGGHHLCASCNNLTGAWYAKDYIDFVNQCLSMIKSVEDSGENINQMSKFCFKIKPLNVIKQIVGMFLCINKGTLQENDSLRAFILDKESNSFPLDYKIFVYYSAVKNLSRVVANGVVRKSDGRIINCSEICHFPFGFQLIHKNESTVEMADITMFTSVPYDFELEVDITAPFLTIKGVMPGIFTD